MQWRDTQLETADMEEVETDVQVVSGGKELCIDFIWSKLYISQVLLFIVR